MYYSFLREDALHGSHSAAGCTFQSYSKGDAPEQKENCIFS
jgi:hypothetical protein